MAAGLEPQDLDRLDWMLQASDGFILFFVSVVGNVARETVLAQVRQKHDGQISVLRLDEDESIVEQIANASGAGPLAVFGLEKLITHSNPLRSKAIVSELNWKRNALTQSGRPLILFVSPFGLSQLANGAPDFFDYRTDVFVVKPKPDPRFWFFHNVSLEPEAARRERDRLQRSLRGWENKSSPSLTGQYGRLESAIQIIRSEVALSNLAHAEEVAEEANEILANLSETRDYEIRLREAQALLDEASGRYREAAAKFRQLLTHRESDRLSRADRTYQMCLNLWLLEQPYEALSILEHDSMLLASGRASQLRLLIQESIGRLREAESGLTQQMGSVSIRMKPLLNLSARYHAARLHLNFGSIESGVATIESALLDAETVLGLEHDGTGFLHLLLARGFSLLGSLEARPNAATGLILVARARGVDSSAAIDAVVQVREMGFNPVELLAESGATDLVSTAESAWG